jgi:hypothetical protein
LVDHSHYRATMNLTSGTLKDAIDELVKGIRQRTRKHMKEWWILIRLQWLKSLYILHASKLFWVALL